MKHYAIKRPDGSWIMASFANTKVRAWDIAGDQPRLVAAGYTCVEVSGFTEVGK